MNYAERFKMYRPLFQQNIKGEATKILAASIGCSRVTIYSYLKGKSFPDNANSKLMIEEGLKILDSKNISYKNQ